MSSTRPPVSGSEAAHQIGAMLDGLSDWRAETLRTVRSLIHAAVPDVVETWKWMGSPVWESGGILVVGNAHKDKVKLTFPRGAQLDDPEGLFNNGLGGTAWRAIDLREGDTLDATAFIALITPAAEQNNM